jgi:hypothetical protein
VYIRSPARAEIVKAVTPIVSKLLQIAQETGANVIDPLKSLCDAMTCPATTPSGEPMYHDSYHLSPSYVRESVRFLDETILDANAAAESIRSLQNVDDHRRKPVKTADHSPSILHMVHHSDALPVPLLSLE